MSGVSHRTAALVWCAGLFLIAAFAAVGAAGVVGVRSATLSGQDIAADEVVTSNLTAQFGHDVDSVYPTG